MQVGKAREDANRDAIVNALDALNGPDSDVHTRIGDDESADRKALRDEPYKGKRDDG